MVLEIGAPYGPLDFLERMAFGAMKPSEVLDHKLFKIVFILGRLEVHH